MEYSYCPNCKKMTGHKRALGWGTFFGSAVTLGASLGAVPFYPKRCIVCGSSGKMPEPSGIDNEELFEDVSEDTKICPQCAEKVKAAAKICRFCRYEFPQVEEMRKKIGRIPCSDGNCVGTINENGVCRVCGKELSAPTIPSRSVVGSLEERLQNLKIRFNELGEKIVNSKNKEEKAKLKLEQMEIEDEMEKCRLKIFRNR